MPRINIPSDSRVPLGTFQFCCFGPDGNNTFAGKTVQLYIGFGPGGTYDLWARTIARHMGKHLPGQPNVVSKNYEGAGSLRLVSFMAQSAPTDGTLIGVISREASLAHLLKANGAQFDSRKFNWLGTPTTETSICMSNKDAKVKTIADLSTTELTVGGAGVGDGTSFYPTALRGLMKMQFRVINGYASTANIFIAMEQREVDGVCESYSSTMARHPDYIRSGSVNVLFQAALKKEPGLGATPSLMDVAPDAQSKEALELLYAGQSIGRPFLAPAGEPPEIVKMQRDAFDATMRDPDFIEDAKRQKLVLKPETGAYLDQLFTQLYATSESIVERVGAYVR